LTGSARLLDANAIAPGITTDVSGCAEPEIMIASQRANRSQRAPADEVAEPLDAWQHARRQLQQLRIYIHVLDNVLCNVLL